ncbi:Type I Iterative PKS [Elasticomyces elasticus]|nr:Type I Iterative PKS [Elasticomyces elasticus]KAK4974925.1 hypothetical protein LTR42_004134 [Elasticomyces elasticus]
MEILYFGNEFPKEDLQDVFRLLHNHNRSVRHPLLDQLISNTTQAIKHEIKQLPSKLSDLIPPFATLFDWAENAELREGMLCGAVEGVLLVLLQLSLYISHVENHAIAQQDLRSTRLTALGVGLLSAAAVTHSPNVADLPLHAAEAVRIAFRMGVHVRAVSHQLEARDLSERPATWAYVVHNIGAGEAEAELEVMAATSSPTSKIFISAVSPTSVTISGPPSRLQALFRKSKIFRDATSIALPVYGGLCHAPHIFGLRDVRAILDKESSLSDFQMPTLGTSTLPLHSTSSGAAYPMSQDMRLFEHVVTELLTKQITWDNVVADVIETASTSKPTDILLGCFGNSIPFRDLLRVLHETLLDTDIKVVNYMTSLTDSPLNDTTPRGTAQAKLAIVGMSCRLPGGATDTEKFWEIMANGLDVSRRIPADRFDIETHFDADGKQMNKTMTEHGCFIDEPGLFDASFFNMSPREAMAVDPQMRLSLVTAYEALEQAGFVPNRTLSTKAERIGTYYGQAADDFLVVAVPLDQAESTTSSSFPAHRTRSDTACSSGLAAIELACQALWNGDVDTAVAGGVNLLTNPDGFTGLGRGHFLTKTHNACKTWDATADGYCRADGVGSVVIKKLEDAQADNDNILGVILGCGTNHSAEAVSITHPHAGHQSYLSRQVLRQAGVNPLDVSYIELHGTGTQAGDYEEMQGILDVYAPDSSPRRRSDQKLHIGSVKANIGHGESVAGTSALIKVLSMLQHNAIPPHVGIKTEINPRFAKDLNNSKRNIHIPFSEVEWPQTPGKKRIAGINNFGAAGGNTTMILEEAPSRPEREADPRSSHVVSVSAKSRKALAGNIERLIAYLDLNSDTVSIADLAYTTTARKHQHQFRIAMSVSDIPQARKQLNAAMNKVDTLPAVAKSSSPPVAFAFTGQGASYQSMDLELYRDVPSFREHIQHLDAMAQAQGFPSFIPAIDGSHHKDHTHAPVVTQLALVCVEIALAEYWASLGVTPDIVIGHSLGEYAAACCAGIISANDAIFMVGRRALMLTEQCQTGSHCMMAVRASLAAIGEASGSRAYTVACVNGPSDVVLSGKADEVDDLAVILEAAGLRCIKLNVAFAFHSEQTDPILDGFEAACAGVVFNEPKLPIISPLLGKVVFDSRTINANYVRRATRETVDFVSALENAYSVSSIAEDTVWIEIGPHPVCANFVKSTLPSTQFTLPSLRRGEDNWKTLSQSIAALHLTGLHISFNDFHAPFASQVRLLDLPSYAWDEKRYWLQYNGDWCLTKGNTYYDDKDSKIEARSPPPVYESLSSLVQNIIEVDVDGIAGTVVMQSDLMQKDFYASAQGHRMNDCGVVTSSIHADIAYTLGNFLYRKFYPKADHVDMDMGNLVVTSGLIAHKGPTSVPQIIQVTVHTDNIETKSLDLTWQSVALDGSILEPFATANITFGDATIWKKTWSPTSHLIQHRIEMLDTMASQGQANRLTRNMAYTLFANNLVDYAEKYRGMQSVVIHDLEAYAEVQLSTKEDGAKFMVPPYFIDSVAHLAGYIMNCSDSMDTQKYYCVTSGWDSMKFAEPLMAGGRYRSYVKMIPTKDDPSVFLGDVYILSAEHNNIIGFVGGIHFRRFPRILLGRFFTAPEVPKAALGQAKIHAPSKTAKISSTPAVVPEPQKASVHGTTTTKPAVVTPKPAVYVSADPIRSEDDHSLSSTVSSSEGIMTPPSGAITVADRALMLIAQETALDVSDLEDSAEFANLGIDSLMSLVLTEKLRGELDVKVNGSLFLDYPTIGDLRSWLVEYYN